MHLKQTRFPFCHACDLSDGGSLTQHMTDITNAEQASFNGLGIAPALMQILDRAKFTVPTPIQVQAIPIAVTGKDIVGIAQTGTGKTLAFTVPIL